MRRIIEDEKVFPGGTVSLPILERSGWKRTSDLFGVNFSTEVDILFEKKHTMGVQKLVLGSNGLVKKITIQPQRDVSFQSVSFLLKIDIDFFGH